MEQEACYTTYLDSCQCLQTEEEFIDLRCCELGVITVRQSFENAASLGSLSLPPTMQDEGTHQSKIDLGKLFLNKEAYDEAYIDGPELLHQIEQTIGDKSAQRFFKCLIKNHFGRYLYFPALTLDVEEEDQGSKADCTNQSKKRYRQKSDRKIKKERTNETVTKRRLKINTEPSSTNSKE